MDRESLRNISPTWPLDIPVQYSCSNRRSQLEYLTISSSKEELRRSDTIGSNRTWSSKCIFPLPSFPRGSQNLVEPEVASSRFLNNVLSGSSFSCKLHSISLYYISVYSDWSINENNHLCLVLRTTALPTAPSFQRRSPIQVLTRPNDA